MLFALVRAPPHFAARGHVVCTCVITRKWRSTTRSASTFLLFLFEKDPRKILIAKDHARERNKPFYAKTKANAFANFEVGRLIKKKKKMEKSAV